VVFVHKDNFLKVKGIKVHFNLNFFSHSFVSLTIVLTLINMTLEFIILGVKYKMHYSETMQIQYICIRI